MVEKSAFRDAMAALSTAVNIVTTSGPAGLGGLTATAVSSVTDTPPTLLVCLNRTSRSYPIFLANRVLCVNILTVQQQELSNLFSNRNVTVQERFRHVDWTRLETGCPVIKDTLANFDCRIAQSLDVGTHTVFFCEVHAIRQISGDALVYFNRTYHYATETAIV